MSPRFAAGVRRDTIEPWVVDLESPDASLDLRSLFDNDHPIEVEIGFGKGRFLLTSALANPGTNWLGIEVRQTLHKYAALRLSKRRLTNALVSRVNARRFFADYVPPQFLQAVHIYFPDPWWKTKHHKRRVWTADLFQLYSEAIAIGGHLHIASDVPMVFDGMFQLAVATPGLVEETSGDATPDCTTNFEDKALREGRTIGRAAFRRLDASSAELG